MPTLFRFLFTIVLLAGLGFAGVIGLAYFVEPADREMTIVVPSKRLNP